MERKQLLQLEMQSLLIYPESFDIIHKMKDQTTTVLKKAILLLKEEASSMDIAKEISNADSFDSFFTNIENNVVQTGAKVIDDILSNITHLLHVPEFLTLADLDLVEKPDELNDNDITAVLNDMEKEHEEQLVVLAMLRQELKDYECLDFMIDTTNSLLAIEQQLDSYKVRTDVQIGLAELIKHADYDLISSLK